MGRTMTFTLSESLKQWMREYAESQGMTMSGYLKVLLHGQRLLAREQERDRARSEDLAGKEGEAPADAPRDGWCALHNVAMTPKTTDRGTFFSHYDGAGGRWCLGKRPKA